MKEITKEAERLMQQYTNMSEFVKSNPVILAYLGDTHCYIYDSLQIINQQQARIDELEKDLPQPPKENEDDK